MANRIFQAVWDAGPEGRSEMLVLMALADSADAETAECYPSVAWIAHGARMSVRTARSVLRKLERDGWIETRDAERPNGSQSSNRYVIQIEKLGLAPLVTRQKRRAAKTAAPSAKTAGVGRQKLPPTGAAKTAAPEQTIKNKSAGAGAMPSIALENLTRYARSCLRAGNPAPLGDGRFLNPDDPRFAELAELLRNEVGHG